MLTGPIFRSLVDSRQGFWIKASTNHIRPGAWYTHVTRWAVAVAAAFHVDPYDDRLRKIFSSELDLTICSGNREIL